MLRDEFDSSSALFECIAFSAIFLGNILRFIGISQLDS